MVGVLFLSNPRDEIQIKEIKSGLENRGPNYSILTYDEVRKDSMLEKLVKEKSLRVIVLFMGYGSLDPEIGGLLRSSFKKIPSLVAILKTASDPIQIPIFLQALQYVDFRREPDALEHLNGAISERIGWDWS